MHVFVFLFLMFVLSNRACSTSSTGALSRYFSRCTLLGNGCNGSGVLRLYPCCRSQLIAEVYAIFDPSPVHLFFSCDCSEREKKLTNDTTITKMFAMGAYCYNLVFIYGVVNFVCHSILSQKFCRGLLKALYRLQRGRTHRSVLYMCVAESLAGVFRSQ